MFAGESRPSRYEVCGNAFKDDPTAVVAGAWTEIDDPVGVCHNRLVVLDHDDRFTRVDEPVQQAEQILDIGQVEAGGRLVQNVNVALLGQMGGELQPLPFATGQGWQRLAKVEITEPDVGESTENRVSSRNACLPRTEKFLRLDH